MLLHSSIPQNFTTFHRIMEDVPMKKTLRTLFAVLALTLCLCLPAFAQEAKPAQPAAKEDKTVTDLTGRDAFLRRLHRPDQSDR